MPRRKSTDVAAPGAGAPTGSSSPGAAGTAVIVPRAWLVTIIVLVMVPWVVQLMMLRVGSTTPDVQADAVGNADARRHVTGERTGPWGTLTTTPIVISPPLEYVSQNWGPVGAPRWYFPPSADDGFEQFLASSGLSADQIAGLHASARPDAATGGITISPDPAFVRDLSPEIRARLYHELEKHPRNVDQDAAYRFYGTSVEAWLPTNLISPATRALVEPLVYRRGDFLYFSDIDLVRPHIEDPAELQRLAKGLLRQATLLVKLHVEASSDVDAIAEYWGRGGRRTDIRPLLESIAGGAADDRIDISHLLPTLARQHLYRYPRYSAADLDRPLLSNCFWTALNFFNVEPDDRYLDVGYALEHLREDYYFVQDQFQLGDVVAFTDDSGSIFHVAVYLADGLVFGKNGSTPLDPWSILPIERLKGHYSQYAGEWHVSYHRRKDF
jgi:hypothetical protein